MIPSFSSLWSMPWLILNGSQPFYSHHSPTWMCLSANNKEHDRLNEQIWQGIILQHFIMIYNHIVFIVALDKNQHKYIRSSCGGHPRLNTLFLKQGLVDQGKRMMALTCAYVWGGRFQGIGTSVGLDISFLIPIGYLYGGFHIFLIPVAYVRWWTVVMFSLLFGSIDHARTFTPRQDHPSTIIV